MIHRLQRGMQHDLRLRPASHPRRARLPPAPRAGRPVRRALRLPRLSSAPPPSRQLPAAPGCRRVRALTAWNSKPLKREMSHGQRTKTNKRSTTVPASSTTVPKMSGRQLPRWTPTRIGLRLMLQAMNLRLAQRSVAQCTNRCPPATRRAQMPLSRSPGRSSNRSPGPRRATPARGAAAA